MAHPRSFELDEILVRPGTYFNPQTEVLLVVDDSAEMDQEIFSMESVEGADWVLVADDVPVDENRRDELLERFQVRYHPGAAGAITDIEDDDDDELEEDHQEVAREDGPADPPIE
jgi:GT2 family glycosyltransferase